MTSLQYLKNVVTLEFDKTKCTGCKQCLDVCPHGVFTDAGKTVELAVRDNCMECGACQRNCQFGAIAVSAGVGCAAAIISSVFSSAGGCGCDC